LGQIKPNCPVDVAIELDLSSSEVENMQQEFWVLNQLDELSLAYLEIKNHQKRAWDAQKDQVFQSELRHVTG
jgi:hypothetical protein